MKDKILIVDDEPANLQLLLQILKPEGYQLAFARNGKDALLAAEKHQPDLVLLDIMMPGMDGYETCRRLKQNKALAKIPVIFITAMDDKEDGSKGFEVGAVDYIIKPIPPLLLLARVKSHLSLVHFEELEEVTRDSMNMLGEATHFNDVETGEHVRRMTVYTVALARAAGWREKECNLLLLAAPLHDMGKIALPENVLKGHHPLSEGEWESIRSHSEIGHRILSRSSAPLFRLAAEVALYHHERWEGNGYPSGIAGEEIPESARIVSIADTFDAMTVSTTYKNALSIEDAFVEIKAGAGTQFDPRLTEIFLSIEPEIRNLKGTFDAM